jgi:uncharacterized protein YceK
MRGFSVFVIVLGIALILSGCTGIYYKQPDQPSTIYSSSDATALVYSDPVSASATDDHYLRWVGFILYPVGLVFDYALNRPLHQLASESPGFYGYTAEDAQLDSQRGGITKQGR